MYHPKPVNTSLYVPVPLCLSNAFWFPRGLSRGWEPHNSIHFALGTISSFPGQQTNFVCLLEPRFNKLWNIYQFSPTQAWSVYGGLSRLPVSIVFLFHNNFCQSRKRPPWLSLIRAAQNMPWQKQNNWDVFYYIRIVIDNLAMFIT